jgi:hypothetical protein
VARTCKYLGDVLRDENKPQEALDYDLRDRSILDQQSATTATDWELRVEAAEARWNVGDDYLAIAASKSDKAEKARLLNLAQHDLLQAQAAMTDAKAHGSLYGDLVNAPTEIERDLARCARLLRAADSKAAGQAALAASP